MPNRPDELTHQQRIDVGRVCFPSEDIPNAETVECILDVLGYLLDGPDTLTQEEQIMVGQACFKGQAAPITWTQRPRNASWTSWIICPTVRMV